MKNQAFSPLTSFLLVSVLALSVSACTDDNPAYNPDPFLPDECRVGSEITETFSDYERPESLDILIVVDDSGDVEDLQSALAEALPDFLDLLVEQGMNIELAVATTGRSGSLGLAPPGTSGPGCQLNSNRIANSTQDNWTQVAACNVQQGTDGDSFQQALSVTADLFAMSSDDLGFFRPRSKRVVLVVSNEDDCSHEGELSGSTRQACLESVSALTSVKLMTDELEAFPNSPEGFVLGVISGPPEEGDQDLLRPVCSSSIGSSFSANRLAKATEALGDQGWFGSSCVESLAGTLKDFRTEMLSSSTVTLCPAKLLAHEPLAVTGQMEDDDFAIRLGSDGFLFNGMTDHCENGELEVTSSAASQAKSIAVTYCVKED